jgi:general secretion pathway protein A
MDQALHHPDEMAGYLGFLMHRRRVESNASLLQHFGFQEDPFGVSPDPRYMYPSQTHQQALASLENGFYNNHGFIAMIAPPGMGKTTLLYRFLEDTEANARSVFLFDIDPDCKPRDFVGYILREFGVTPAQTSSEMHQQLGEALIRETEEGRKCVVVIDEAQNLSDAVLERVRLITNFENSQGKLLQVILSGQPQLTDKLMQESLVQLRQRISTFCCLDLLSQEETISYIDYRLRQAGYDGDPVFTDEALKLIAESAGGTPRTINNLCYNALAICSDMKIKHVDVDIVAKVVTNLHLVPQLKESFAALDSNSGELYEAQSSAEEKWPVLRRWVHAFTSEARLWVPATAGVLILSVLGALRLSGVGSSEPPNPDNDRILSPNAAAESLASPEARISNAIAIKPATIKKTVASGNAAMDHGSTKALGNPKPVRAQQQKNLAGLPASSDLYPNLAPPAERPAHTTQVGWSTGPAVPGQASLIINCIQADADIEIDGAFVGNTPSTISVAPGTHLITVKKDGFTGWNKTLKVTGGVIHLNAELTPETAGQ